MVVFDGQLSTTCENVGDGEERVTGAGGGECEGGGVNAGTDGVCAKA